ncbi:MAG TPA: PQQ-dependent sugar dehydrogenase [Anaerolineales bacterium]|nr:PQQ-dependent sugar dehydrogenase [Anaerolineales bacterium]
MAKSSRIFSLIAVCGLAISTISARGGLMAAATTAPFSLDFTTVASGLNKPVFVTNAGDGSQRLFIVQQSGEILVMDHDASSPNSTAFLDISSLSGFISSDNGGDTEQGLLGLAFDPGYSSNGYFYITYTTDTGGIPCPYVPTSGQTCNYTTTLARYHATPASDVADSASGFVLLAVPKIYSNHNGGMIAFGPDGYLYMSVGDGGSGGDPDGNGQSLDTLSAKILRLDVDGPPDLGKNYAVPPTNPFYGSSDPNVQQEIWAYGLRNPWRFSFDKSRGDLYIGDVGQDRQEEVDFQSHASTGGQNYGWHILEGNLCYRPSTGCAAPPNYVAPVTTYNHGTNDSYGCALTGGYVYRGTQSVLMQGYYFYGDYCSGKVLGLIKNARNTWTSYLVASTSYQISSFGQDEGGELYLTDLNGQVIKISQHPAYATKTIPSQGGFDGFIIETSAGSGVGGVLNSTGKWFSVGDTTDNRQVRAILSFNTAVLPPLAVVDSATLRIRLNRISSDPFSILGDLAVDMAVPNFGPSPALEAGDFQAAADYPDVATFNSVPSGGWYSAPVSSNLSAINLTGTTQFRLTFPPSNDDGISNSASFYSGRYGVSFRPQLVIQYHSP